jgi:hypothetical protein
MEPRSAEVKTEFSRARKCWQAAVLAAAVLGACGPVEENPGEQEELATEDKPLTGVTLGLATGTFYVSGEQPLSNFAEQASCEFSNLGAKWIRIEADSAGVDADTYRRIVQKAHAKSIKVLVVVPARYCGTDTDQTQIDAFTTSYVSHLNDLVTNTFTGTAAADAYEIGNKPNLTEALCSDAVSRFRVAPNAFAWLLRRTWDWKTSNARPELIVSGGVLNTFTTQPFWNTLVASQAFVNGSGKIRPFDYFGIQPYNDPGSANPVVDGNYLNCINAGLTTCFTTWKNNVTSGLKSAATRLNTATGTTDTKLFATEFGFQVVSGPSCTGTENCTLLLSAKTGTPPTDPPPYLQLASAMSAAGDALVNSGVTPFAIWNDYRDEGGKGFGLRSVWDATTKKYLVKTAGWNKFRSMSGSTGNSNSEACWVKGAYAPVDFENGDTLRTTSAGDWAYGYYKGECAAGERIMGVSKSTANSWSRLGICYKDPLDANRYTHPTPALPACTVRNVLAGSDRGTTQTTSVDWDPDNYKAECAPTEYVAGVAQSQDHKFSHVLCCPATVSATSCTTVAFGSADNRQATDSGDWDSAGFKGECGVGRYVAGVSRTPAGQPNALLCCNQ